MRVGEHEIFFHYGPRAILAALVRGKGPEMIQEELKGILEDIHANHDHEMADFNGNVETTEFAQPYLKRALLE
jgi:hypothetical protein